MSLLDENEVFQNAEQSIIDRLSTQIEQNIRDELTKKADAALLNYLSDRINHLLDKTDDMYAQLQIMQDKMREMEGQLNNCLRLDNLIYGNDNYRNEARDVWCGRVDTVDSAQYDDAGV
jgi:hypothetical protein